MDNQSQRSSPAVRRPPRPTQSRPRRAERPGRRPACPLPSATRRNRPRKRPSRPSPFPGRRGKRQGWLVRRCLDRDRRNRPKPKNRRKPSNRSQIQIPKRGRRLRLPDRLLLRVQHPQMASRPEIPELPRRNRPPRERRHPAPPRLQDLPHPSTRRLRRNPPTPLLRLRNPASGHHRFGRPPRRRGRKRPGHPQAGRNCRPCRRSAGKRRREPPPLRIIHRRPDRKTALPRRIGQSLQRPWFRIPNRRPRQRRKRPPPVRSTPRMNPG